MSNQVTILNLADVIRDKVRNTILDAIPKEQLDKLILEQFNAFFNTRVSSSFSYGEQRTPFQCMVSTQIEALIKEKVKESIKEPIDNLVSEWDGNNHRIIGELVEKMAPTFFQSVMQNMTAMMLQNMRNHT